MSRQAPKAIDSLQGWPGRFVTPSQLAVYLGEKSHTIRAWCRSGRIVGARHRSPEGDRGDWLIPIEAALLLEHRLGFNTKSTDAA